MDRARTLEVIRNKREMKSTSWEELAKVIGKSPHRLPGKGRVSSNDGSIQV